MTALLLALCVAGDGPKLDIGRETTFVDGPVGKDGFVDFATALNARLRGRTTPQSNSNVLFWMAFGPQPSDKPMPAAFWRELGIAPPAPDGKYLLSFKAFLNPDGKLPPEELKALAGQYERIVERPWTAKEYPKMAALLAANDYPLKVAVDGTKRPNYLNPLVVSENDKGPGLLIGALLPSVFKTREIAHSLRARALLAVGEGRYEDAWQDALAIHRLARLVSRGACMIEALVGVAIEGVANTTDLILLENAPWSGAVILAKYREVAALPPAAPMSEKMNLGERLFFLDSAQSLARGEAVDAALPDPKTLKTLDVGAVMKLGNPWYDRMAAGMALPTRAARTKELSAIEAELQGLTKTSTAQLIWAALDETALTRLLTNRLVSMLSPAVRRLMDAEDRVTQSQANLQAAYALAAYQRDHGRYPAKLEELSPRYLAKLPTDLFSGKALIYKPEAKGYVLYSVGVNGTDDGGRGPDDKGDDLVVRMPRK